MDYGTLIAGLAIAAAIAWGLNQLAEALGLRATAPAPPLARGTEKAPVTVDPRDLPVDYQLCGEGACPPEPEYRHYDGFYYYRAPSPRDQPGRCGGADGGSSGHCGCYLMRREANPTTPEQRKWKILARPGEGVGSTAIAGNDWYVFHCVCLRWTGTGEEPKSLGETDRTAAAIWIRFPEDLDRP